MSANHPIPEPPDGNALRGCLNAMLILLGALAVGVGIGILALTIDWSVALWSHL